MPCVAVSTLAIDAISGALTALAGGLNFSDIGGLVVDPSGNFAYGLTGGGAGDSILILKIDPSTGALGVVAAC